MKRGEVRPVFSDGIGGQGSSIVAQIRFLNTSSQVSEVFLTSQKIYGRSVAQRFQYRIFIFQWMHFRKAPAYGPVPAIDGPEDGTVLSAVFFNGFEKRWHLNMLPFPVPDAFRFGHARLGRLILSHAGFVRIAPGHHGHMDRVRQCGKDRFHPPAESAFLHHAGEEPVGIRMLCIGNEKRIQRNQYNFTHTCASETRLSA